MVKLLAPRVAPRRLVISYGLAAAAVAATALVRALLDPTIGDRGVFIFFALPLIVSAYYGGLGPGLFATGLGLVAGVFLFLHPKFSWELRTVGDFIRAGSFLLIGCSISALTEALIRSRDRFERAVLELRKREEDLGFTLDAGRMGSWEWNVRTNSIRWSDNLEALHGVPEGTFDGTYEAFLRMIHPEDRPELESAVRQALEGADNYDMEFRVPGADGSLRWMRGTGRVIRGEDGEPERMVGLGIDITARKEAELAASHLAAIVETSGDAIIGKTLEGIITSWNAGAERLYGYTEAEALGCSCTMLVPPEKLEEYRAVLAGRG